MRSDRLDAHSFTESSQVAGLRSSHTKTPSASAADQLLQVLRISRAVHGDLRRGAIDVAEVLVRAPLMESEQDGSIRIQDLTEVFMARGHLGLAKERLVPFEAARDVAYAKDCPCAFHRISDP